MPKLINVSVIIPAFNCENTISETLQSVFAQELEPEMMEIIVVNDGSSDCTQEILETYGKSITLINTPNRGAGIARNKGISLAKGQYIQFLDADDLLMPNKLKIQIKAMQESGNEVAYGDWQRFKQTKEKIEIIQTVKRQIEGRSEIALFTYFWCPPAALLFSRSIVEKIKGFREDLPVIQDARYFLDAALHSAQFVYTPGVMAQYRVSEGNSLSTRNKLQFNIDIKNNAKQIYALWKADIKLDKPKKNALLEVFSYAATQLYFEDRSGFKECIIHIKQIQSNCVSHQLNFLQIAGKITRQKFTDLLRKYKKLVFEQNLSC